LVNGITFARCQVFAHIFQHLDFQKVTNGIFDGKVYIGSSSLIGTAVFKNHQTETQLGLKMLVMGLACGWIEGLVLFEFFHMLSFFFLYL
jgi:hypothetical protein